MRLKPPRLHPRRSLRTTPSKREAIAANTEKDPKAQLEKLDKWKNDYPVTEFEVDRLALYLQDYGAVKDYHNQMVTAQALRKTLVDNLQLIQTIYTAFQQMVTAKSSTPEDLSAVIDVSNYIINNADAIFDPSKMPQGQTADGWKALKPQMVDYAKVQLDTVVEIKGMDAVLARLKDDPTRVVLNQWLGQEYRGQGAKDPQKIVLALYHYGRVSVYDGPGSLSAQIKSGSKKYFDSQYKGYHGSMDGADQVLVTAKANALPPDGFDIKSITKIQEEKNAAEDAAAKANPMLHAWKEIKTGLTGDGSAAYADALKDAGRILARQPSWCNEVQRRRDRGNGSGNQTEKDRHRGGKGRSCRLHFDPRCAAAWNHGEGFRA